jgi:hypothetical protein
MILFYFILYLNEFKESKYLNGTQKILLNYSFIWVVKKFKQKVLSLKSIQKNFLLSTFNQKDLQEYIKSLSNSIQISTPIHSPSLCCHQGMSVPRKAFEIKRYLSIILPLFPFGPLHLPKCYSSRVNVTPWGEAQ